MSKRSMATEFKPGQEPFNKLPVGSKTVRIDKNDKKRTWIKVAEPNVWILLSVYLWEFVHGPVPKGYVIHHVDGNPMNDVVENLEIVSRAEHIRIHFDELRQSRPSQTHEKLKTCFDCGAAWMGRGRSLARCDECKKIADDKSKKAYRDKKRSERMEVA